MRQLLLIALFVVCAPNLAWAQGNEEFEAVRNKVAQDLQQQEKTESESPKAAKFPLPETTSSDDVELFVDSNRLAIVALSSNWCGACKEMTALLGSRKAPIPILIYDVTDTKTRTIPRLNIPIDSVPAIAIFKDGKPIDLIFNFNSARGPSSGAEFDDLIARSTEGTRALRLRKLPMSYSGKEIANVLTRNSVGGFIIPGVNLSGLNITNAYFGGSDLRNTNWTNTLVQAVVFSGSDLSGAVFDGAELQNVFWGKCVCPNGVSSEKYGYTCPID